MQSESTLVTASVTARKRSANYIDAIAAKFIVVGFTPQPTDQIDVAAPGLPGLSDGFTRR
jgi:hypothetical protein